MRGKSRFSPGAPVGYISVNQSSKLHRFPSGSSSLGGILIGALFLSSCAPTVNLATPDPIKVDIAVRLDVYQKSAPTKAKEEQSSLEVAANRRLRSGEIQQLKNDGIVGEDRDGYLVMRKNPTDPKYLAYAKGVVDEENNDRAFLYLTNAQTQNKPLELIEREYAQLWADRAFPGEWVQKENGTWIQK
jgi:uncharacterized protein YdbL (DUF1318 family)